MSLVDLAKGLGGLLPSVASTLLMVWLFSRMMDKYQEKDILQSEQNDKHMKIIIDLTKELSTLSSVISEGNKKTEEMTEKVDEVSRKIDSIEANKKECRDNQKQEKDNNEEGS